jgi:hypothetical protein
MQDATRPRVTAVALAAGAVVLAASTLAAPWAGTAQAAPARPTVYQFATLDNSHGPTFNELLGINNEGVIAGYFGSGTQFNANMGYLLGPPYGQRDYRNENFPKSVQTQATGLNDKGVTVGFFSTQNNASNVNNNFGWYAAGGHFHEVNFPTGTPDKPPVDRLLGVNNHDIAVGFFTNAAHINRGYTYNITKKIFTRVLPPGATNTNPGGSLTATAINNNGNVAGFYIDSRRHTDAFLAGVHGSFRTLDYPGATATQALGVNDHDEVVGAYTDGSGSTATTHGFTWTQASGFATIDDPYGTGTTINGVNNAGDLVGFYVDGDGFTHGMLANPARKTTLNVSLSPMPAGIITTGFNKDGSRFIQLNATGFAPNSAHWVDLFSDGQANPYGEVTANSAGQLVNAVNVPSIPDGSQVWILDNGTNTNPIAKTPALTSANEGPYPVQAVENGFPAGSLRGHATVVYSPAAQTIAVTLTASGLTPGPHAVDISLGFCTNQGPRLYKPKDFTADSHGNIDGQTHVITGVTVGMPLTGWYVTVHQGDSSEIMSNGQPGYLFRPLFCDSI